MTQSDSRSSRRGWSGRKRRFDQRSCEIFRSMAKIPRMFVDAAPHPPLNTIGVGMQVGDLEEWWYGRPERGQPALRHRAAGRVDTCPSTRHRHGCARAVRVLRGALARQPLLPFLQHGLSRCRNSGAFGASERGRRIRPGRRGWQLRRRVRGVLQWTHRSRTRGSCIRNRRSTPGARHRNPECSNGLPSWHVLQAFVCSMHTCWPAITR